MKILMLAILSMMIGFSSCAQSSTKVIEKDETPEMSTVTPKIKEEKKPEMSTVMPRHLPYYQIPEYPASYSAPNVLARTIDGLGYRYHWATKGLSESDLAYKPSEDGRSAAETLEHLYGLASVIQNGIMGKPNVRPSPPSPATWDEKRKATLDKLKSASDLLKKMESLDGLKITFQRGEKTSDSPFWHMMNGPLADAIYHVGQIVVFRRANGNPQNPRVNVFMGKTEVK